MGYACLETSPKIEKDSERKRAERRVGESKKDRDIEIDSSKNHSIYVFFSKI